MHIVRESIFTSSIRALCVSFFVIIGIAIGFIPVIFGFGALFSQKGDFVGNFDIIAPYTGGKKAFLKPNVPVILKMDIQGMIGAGDLSDEEFKAKLNETLVGPFKSSPVKAILLYTNSPGGFTNPSANIYNYLEQYKKQYNVPIYTFVNGMCASGALYISCAADKICTTDMSLIGSVGVTLVPFFNVSEALDKIGVKSVTISAGIDKDEMNPFRPWKPDETEDYQRIVNFYYRDFVDLVTKTRPQINRDALVNEYGARIFTAPEAKDIGFIDEYGQTLEAVTHELAKQAGIDNNYQVVELRGKRKLKDLFRSESPLVTGKMSHTMELASPLAGLQNKLKTLENATS